MSKALYYEARGEGVYGQVAVAQVVMNRVRSPLWPDTVCDVISQEGQFPWYPGSSANWHYLRPLALKITVADKFGLPLFRKVKKSVFFNRVKFNDPRLVFDASIGNHKFYSFKRGKR